MDAAQHPYTARVVQVTTPASHALCPSRLRGWLRLVYTEVRARLPGSTAERYHYSKGLALQEIGLPSRAVEHYSRRLALADDARIRALLAFNYAAMGRFEESAREYRRAAAEWSDPWIRLTLAQAELIAGHVDAAENLIVELESSSRDERLRAALAELRKTLPT